LAQKALKAGNRDYALDLWRKTRARFPFLSATYAVDLALDLGCYDEVETLLLDAERRYPDSEPVVFARGLTRVALLRGDTEEALRRAQRLLRKFPSKPQGYHLVTDCLNRLGRHDEAEAVMARGASKLPTDFYIIEHYARLAMHRRAWPEAFRRWDLMRRTDNIAVPVGKARCLREMNRLAEAEQMLAEASAHHKPTVGLFAELANLATTKGDIDEAIGWWQEAIRYDPLSAEAYTKGAAAMRSIGREMDADDLLRTAVATCKADLTVHLEYARSAHRRRDWTAAKERWAIAHDRFPECAEARQKGNEAIAALDGQPI
jgi:tetratricopeptide (TPR) repeat protein